MIKRSYLVAAAVSLAVSGASFASDTPSAKSERAAPKAQKSVSAPQCDRLSGAQKEQCLRDAQQAAGSSSSATGSTAGGAAGSTGTKGSTNAAPTGGSSGMPR
jgi:hypothetical protein